MSQNPDGWWCWLFPRLRRFWENVRPFIPRLRPLFCFVLFKVDISSRTLIPLFRPGSVHSGSASSNECAHMFPDELRVSPFLDRFRHYAWTVVQSAQPEFIGSNVYACLGVTSYLHFWQIGRGLLRATAARRGRNVHRLRVSTQC